MFSKRIVISIIVIGCFVHFVTCQKDTKDDKKKNLQNTSKSPTNPTTPDKKKPTPRPSSTQTRELSPKNDEDAKGKGSGKAKPAAEKPTVKKDNKKPPAADKNQETPENTANNPEGADGEPAEEKPVGRIRKVFRRINNFRKKMCPFRFFGRLIKTTMGANKPKPTADGEEP